jgi:hypothetical protein
MRLLITIPHFFDPRGGKGRDGREHGSLARDPEPRLKALSACLSALHQVYGAPQCVLDVSQRRTRPANQDTSYQVEIVICTTQGRHLLAGLPAATGAAHHQPTQAEPMLLGFECQAVLRDRLGQYDYYCYLEDDLILHDPWFFRKLAWFSKHLGDHRLLQPNRFEAGPHPVVRKAYVDGDQAPRVTARFQDLRRARRLVSTVLGMRVVFRRALNPHAGCYFLNAAQMEHWVKQPYFLDRDIRYVGPLESAASLGIMRAFEVYKPTPANAAFLEIEHYGTQFLGKIRLPCSQ